MNSGRINGAYASVAVLQEVIFWLLRENRPADIVKTINFLINIKNLEWVELNESICLNAAALMEEYSISAFDAYHAATAISRDNKIMSSDHAFDKIKSIERLDPLSIA